MKRFLALTVMGIFMMAMASSCGSSGGAHCDAYGDASEQVENDMAAI